MHVDHRVPIVEFEFGKGLIAQDTGVVYGDIDTTPLSHNLIDHRLHRCQIGDRCAIRHRLSASVYDFLSHKLSGGSRAAATVDAAPEIVHNHFCAAAP